MRVLNLKLTNFRNIKDLEIKPEKNVNVIYGDNAQGKTNLIESIWICTGLKNFRSHSNNEWINFNSKYFIIDLDFKTEKRKENIKIAYNKDTKILNILKNDVKKNTVSSLAGGFLGVVFSPNHLDLINGSPFERRVFLNYALGQLKPHYISLVSKYEKTLNQRNALLRDLKSMSDKMMLQVWNESLAGLGALIIEYRYKYILFLKEHALGYYKGISGAREKLGIKYLSSVKFDEKNIDIKQINESYIKALNNSLDDDKRLGYTSVGIHRDDIGIFLDKKSAKTFGSQGQKRSCVLALKLAESKIIEDISKEKPIIFLDDVLSELDEKRQRYILENLNDRQIFITCCDKNIFNSIKKDKVFHMENGIIKEENF